MKTRYLSSSNIIKFKCLDCGQIKTVDLNRIRQRDGSRQGDSRCNNCKSWNTEKMKKKQLTTRSEKERVTASKELSSMVAKRETTKKLEEISLISDRLTIDLIDIYLDTSRLIAGLSLLDNHNYSYVEQSIKLLDKNNEKLFELKEKIQQIRKISGK